MEKELRKNFVFATMALMCLVFAVFLGVNYYRQQYWYAVDTYQLVRWVTQSGMLMSEDDDSSGRELLEYANSYDAVIAVIVSENGDILEQEYIVGSELHPIPDRIIRRIIEQGADGWHIGSFVYDMKELPDAERLIVMVDTRDSSNLMWKIFSTVLLILLGVTVLLLITIFLSRFVTQPAKAAIEREQRFISDASHELKTPLGAISINAQALLATQGESKHLRNILSESERMSRLIERLLTLSRLDELAENPKTAFSLSSCTEEMVLTYESVAFDKGIRYDYDIAEGIRLYGSADDLRQLLAILIDNAIKHTDAGGAVTISLTEQSGSILLRVVNSGAGIAPEDLPHIFDRFYKSDGSRSEDSFGLGLSIAKKVADRNGGVITAESIPQERTTFTVTFR